MMGGRETGGRENEKFLRRAGVNTCPTKEEQQVIAHLTIS
jgi:hypothetical protein